MNKIHHLLDLSIHKNKKRPAITDLFNHLSYNELGEHISILQSELVSVLTEPSEPILFISKNNYYDIVCFIAIWRAGGTAIPIHVKSTVNSWQAVLSSTKSRKIVYQNKDDLPVEILKGLTLEGTHVICLHDKQQPYPTSLAGAALVVFTSGSTGNPKGVIQLHDRYIEKLKILNELIEPIEGGATLQFLKLTFSMGQWSSFLTLINGGTLYLFDSFSTRKFHEFISHNSFDMIPAVPTMFRKYFGEGWSQHLPNDPVVDKILLGGEILPKSLAYGIANVFKSSRLFDIYGLTETNSADFISAPDSFKTDSGSLGKATPGVNYRILNDKGESSEIEEFGELLIKTEFLCKGYLSTDGVALDLTEDGYLKTGDMAVMDINGRVRLVGRKKEIISCGGNKISPIEIETIFATHPEVESCVAVGIPDSLYGEVIGLMVVSHSLNLSKHALLQWSEGRIEKHKLPSEIIFSNEIITGPTGKLDRNKVLKKFISR